MRAYTPKDQKAVKAAAETFRTNPEFDTTEAITNLETGEALVSFLDGKGAPSIVERARILFPLSQIGAINEAQRKEIIEWSGLGGKYDTPIDRESAFEILLADQQKAQQEQMAMEEKKTAQAAKAAASEPKASRGGKAARSIGATVLTAAAGAAMTSVTRSIGTAAANAVTGKKSSSTSGKNIANKAITNATSSAIRTLTRSLLGSLVK